LGTPALMLSTGIAVHGIMGRWKSRVVQALGALFLAAAAGVYITFHVSFLKDVDRSRFLNSEYYIPLANQLATAKTMAEHGVDTKRFYHLSGAWYQRPYDYLLTEMTETHVAPEAQQWALAEDLNLRKKQPERANEIQSRAQTWEGKVGMIFFSDPKEWRAYMDRYYNLPVQPGEL